MNQMQQNAERFADALRADPNNRDVTVIALEKGYAITATSTVNGRGERDAAIFTATEAVPDPFTPSLEYHLQAFAAHRASAPPSA